MLTIDTFNVCDRLTVSEQAQEFAIILPLFNHMNER